MISGTMPDCSKRDLNSAVDTLLALTPFWRRMMVLSVDMASTRAQVERARPRTLESDAYIAAAVYGCRRREEVTRPALKLNYKVYISK